MGMEWAEGPAWGVWDSAAGKKEKAGLRQQKPSWARGRGFFRPAARDLFGYDRERIPRLMLIYLKAQEVMDGL